MSQPVQDAEIGEYGLADAAAEQGSEPLCVRVQVTYMFFQAVVSALILLAAASTWRHPAQPTVRVADNLGLIADTAWPVSYLVLSVKLTFGVSDRHPWAWAWTFALLFWRCAACLLYLILVLIQFSASTLLWQWVFVLFIVGWTSVHFGLAVALFRSRTAFGIGVREGWRTVRMKGGWALVVCAFFELVPPLYVGYLGMIRR